MTNRESYDVVIVGAGIAGTALAHFLSERGMSRVLVMEREAQAARHASGRSAGMLMEFDASPALQRLKVLGGDFLRDPPEGFSERPLLDERGALVVFDTEQWPGLIDLAHRFDDTGMRFELLSADEAFSVVDVLRVRELAGALLLPRSGCIDVHELLSSYIRHSRAAGVDYRFGVEVQGVRPAAARGLEVITAAGVVTAETVVNAAGAWAGALGELALATPIEMAPYRRSLVTFAAPLELEVHRWPLVWSESHRFYFRPESTGLLFCPMDEDPSPPGDVSPDDQVFAEGIERLRALAPRLVPPSLGRRWAGLRTFSPDRVPVVGYDDELDGFFWLAGQGGCGIETSPILGRIAADLVIDGRTDAFDAGLLAPARFGA